MTASLVSAVSFSAPVIRCARGAWGDRTHSAYGTVTVAGETLDWNAYRNFDRAAAAGERVTVEVVLIRAASGRELTGAKWEKVRRAVRLAFKGAVERHAEELEAARPVGETVPAERFSVRLSAVPGGGYNVMEGGEIANGGTARGFVSEAAAGTWIAEFLANEAADALPHFVAGRSIDGAEYLTRHGFGSDFRESLVMTAADAREIAEREETKARATRSPENGVYQIKAHVWTGPALYSLADYDRDAAEAAELDAYLSANA